MVLIALANGIRTEAFIVTNAHAGNDAIITTLTLPRGGWFKGCAVSGTDSPTDSQTTFGILEAGGFPPLTFGAYVTAIRVQSRRLVAGVANVTAHIVVFLE